MGRFSATDPECVSVCLSGSLCECVCLGVCACVLCFGLCAFIHMCVNAVCMNTIVVPPGVIIS